MTEKQPLITPHGRPHGKVVGSASGPVWGGTPGQFTCSVCNRKMASFSSQVFFEDGFVLTRCYPCDRDGAEKVATTLLRNVRRALPFGCTLEEVNPPWASSFGHRNWYRITCSCGFHVGTAPLDGHLVADLGRLMVHRVEEPHLGL